MAAHVGAENFPNSHLELFSSSDCGRGIKTKTAMKKGKQILSCEPYAFVSRSERLGQMCDWCLISGDELQRCSCCKMTYYCGIPCQKMAWRAHKLECKHLKGISPVMPSDTVRLLALLLIKNSSISAEWLDELVTHAEQIRKEKGEVFSYFFEALTKYLGSEMRWSGEIVFNAFCKINCNAFTISDGESKPLGLGMYENLTFINHSCKPNCIPVFTGNVCHIRTISDIQAEEEVCISYTELLRPHQTRCKELKQQYYFECKCARCTEEDEHGSQLNSLKCRNENCYGAIGFDSDAEKGGSCPVCGLEALHRWNSPDCMKLYDKIDATLLSDNKMTCPESLTICEDLLREVQKTLHPDNYHMVKIIDKTSDLSIELGLWNKALYYCRQSLVMYQKFYPMFYPSIAIQLFRIGKLEIYLNMLDKGISTLSQAEAVMKVCYGGEHPLYQQLSALLYQTVQEKSLAEQQVTNKSKRAMRCIH